MLTLLPPVALLVISGVLLCSGYRHIAQLELSRVELQQQGMWPLWTLRPLPILLAGAELGIGGSLLISYVFGSATLRTVAAVGAIGLFTLFSVIVLILLRRRQSGLAVPCGCGDQGVNVSGAVLARAISLGVLTVPILAGSSPIALRTGGWFAILIATGLGLSLWNFPRALAIPGAEFRAATET